MKAIVRAALDEPRKVDDTSMFVKSVREAATHSIYLVAGARSRDSVKNALSMLDDYIHCEVWNHQIFQELKLGHIPKWSTNSNVVFGHAAGDSALDVIIRFAQQILMACVFSVPEDAHTSNSITLLPAIADDFSFESLASIQQWSAETAAAINARVLPSNRWSWVEMSRDLHVVLKQFDLEFATLTRAVIDSDIEREVQLCAAVANGQQSPEAVKALLIAKGVPEAIAAKAVDVSLKHFALREDWERIARQKSAVKKTRKRPGPKPMDTKKLEAILREAVQSFSSRPTQTKARERAQANGARGHNDVLNPIIDRLIEERYGAVSN